MWPEERFLCLKALSSKHKPSAILGFQCEGGKFGKENTMMRSYERY